jgi:hypothetical protein
MLRRAACVLPLVVFATAAMAGAERKPEDMLKGLYAQYDAHGHPAARHVDARALMTPQLARAYAKVTRAEAGDAPALDWDVFVNAQDADVQHLNLTTAPAGRNETVTADFDNLGQPMTVIYIFAHTPAGWRIDDIRYPPDHTFPKGFSLQAFARRAG